MTVEQNIFAGPARLAGDHRRLDQPDLGYRGGDLGIFRRPPDVCRHQAKRRNHIKRQLNEAILEGGVHGSAAPRGRDHLSTPMPFARRAAIFWGMVSSASASSKATNSRSDVSRRSASPISASAESVSSLLASKACLRAASSSKLLSRASAASRLGASLRVAEPSFPARRRA